MKYLFILLTITFLPALSAQSRVSTININNLEGVLFGEDYQLSFVVDEFDGRFTPTLKDIEEGERILSSLVGSSNKSIRRSFRQYVGLVKNKSKYLVIHLVNTKCFKKLNYDKADLYKHFQVVLSEPDKKQVSLLYIIDLDNKMIGLF